METFRIKYERVLTASDSKRNIPFPVQVPEGTAQINIHFAFTPQVVENFNNLLTLTVLDPSGWRGAGHRHAKQHVVELGASRASPGYLVKPILPGEWTVIIDTHMIMPGPDCAIQMEVSGSDQPQEGDPPRWQVGHTTSRGPGWYRGDLHSHTVHSDAGWDVAGLVRFARKKKFDFITLSDHNTVAGLAEMDSARADDLLTMGGIELTTFWGHALALGLRDWVDWRIVPGKRMMGQIAREVMAQGGTFIIAHPMEVGDPYCTGCNWGYLDVMPGPARVVEAWNGSWISDSNNEKSLALITDWLNQGYKLAITAGSDNHSRLSKDGTYGFNVVYAEDLSEAEILRAVRAGHLYLSAGPHLDLQAVNAGQKAMMGDVLDARPDLPVEVTILWADCPANATLALVVDGSVKESLRPAEQGAQTWEIKGDQAKWCLVTLRDASGTMLAITNPIYLDGRS